METKALLRFLGITSAVIAIGTLCAWAGSHHGVTLGHFPLFAIAVIAAFAIQWLAYIPAAIFKTEKYYDLTGSLSYIGISVFLLIFTPEKNFRTYLLALLVIIWAARLGWHLFTRIDKAGKDDRFDELKTKPMRFFTTWNVQGLWITLTASAAWIGMTSKHQEFTTLSNFYLALGIVIWLIGFSCEAIADAQKRQFKADPANNGKFIHTGLWAKSQHPNYFGEITLWLGALIIALPTFSGSQFIGILSPLFVIFLLTKVSGIPLLDKKAEEKWGDDAAYQEYKSKVPVLVPKIF